MPQIKDFTLSKIIEFAQEKVDIHNYLPDFEDDPTPNRVWFCNLGTNRMWYLYSEHSCRRRLRQIYWRKDVRKRKACPHEEKF